MPTDYPNFKISSGKNSAVVLWVLMLYVCMSMHGSG